MVFSQIDRAVRIFAGYSAIPRDRVWKHIVQIWSRCYIHDIAVIIVVYLERRSSERDLCRDCHV